MLAFQPEYGEYFERAVAEADGTPARVDRQLGHRRAGRRASPGGRGGRPDGLQGDPEAVAALAGLVEAKTISHGAGKRGPREARRKGGDPAEIVEREGLAQISDSPSWRRIGRPRRSRPSAEAAEQVRQGNEKAIGRIVGAVMKESKGPRAGTASVRHAS